MRRVKRWRYYCDFCKKAGGRSLAEHEAHCCGNPNRVCRMCRLIQEVQQPIAALMDALDSGGLDALRLLAAECPACIIAAIKQRRIRKGADFNYDTDRVEYDFRAETTKLFARLDEDQDAYGYWQ